MPKSTSRSCDRSTPIDAQAAHSSRGGRGVMTILQWHTRVASRATGAVVSTEVTCAELYVATRRAQWDRVRARPRVLREV